MTNSETPPKGDVAERFFDRRLNCRVGTCRYGCSSFCEEQRNTPDPSGPAREAPSQSSDTVSGSSLSPVPAFPDATGLKACPFCGSENLRRNSIEGIECRVCHIEFYAIGNELDADAWNRRAPPSPQVTREPLTDLENRWRFAKVDRAADYMKRLYACGDELVERIVALCAQVQHEHHVSKQWQENFQKVRAAHEETTTKLTAADERIAALREDVERHRDLLDKVKDDGWAATATNLSAMYAAMQKRWFTAEASLAERDATIAGLREQNERDHRVAVETITGVHNEAKALLETAVRAGIEAVKQFVLGGRFLSDEALTAKFAKEVASGLESLDPVAILAQIK